MAVEDNALFQDQHGGYDIAEDARGAPKLDALTGYDIPCDLTAYDGNANPQLSLYLGCISHEEHIRRKEFAADFSIQDQCPNKGEAPFEFTPLINHGRRVRC